VHIIKIGYGAQNPRHPIGKYQNALMVYSRTKIEFQSSSHHRQFISPQANNEKVLIMATTVNENMNKGPRY
jgi:hypothetical protein